MTPPPPRHTPDGRYFVMIGQRGPRLWRATNPAFPDTDRDRLTRELMSARRAIKSASDEAATATARVRVDAAKIALGERGPPWWTDGAPDLNRRLVAGTDYAKWWAGGGD